MGYLTTQYLATGGVQTLTVSSSNAGTITFDMWASVGAQGSPGVGGAPGYGGRVTGTITAATGDTISIYVGEVTGYGYNAGGAGGTANSETISGNVYGYNGGHGAGSSAILQNGQLVAEAGGGGGGGGTGGYGNPNPGGGGGNGGGAPTAGQTGTNASYGSNPGGGGGVLGGAGGALGTYGGSGTAGAANSGGIGGAGGNGGGGNGPGGGGGGGGGTIGGSGGGGAGANSAGGGGGGGQSTATGYAITSAFFDGYNGGPAITYLTYTVAPVVTVTAPSSTVTATSQPTVTFTYANAAPSAQTSFSVAVFAEPSGGWPTGLDGTGHYTGGALLPVWSTTVFGVATSVQVGVGLTNGQYRAYVQATDTGPGQETSAWAYTTWTQNVTGPAAPTGNTATAYPAVARVLLTIPNGSPPSAYNIQRSLDGGNTWNAVLGGTGFPATAGTTYFWDRAAPREIQLYYRIQSVNGSIVGSWTGSTALPAYLLNNGAEWITCAGQSSLDGPLILQGPNLQGLVHEDQAVYSPEGRVGNVVVGGTIHGEQFVQGTGTAMLIFAFPNDAAYYNFLAMRALRQPILYRSMYGDTSANGGSGLEQFWIRIGPDAGIERFGGGDRAGVGLYGRGGQIRTIQIAAYVVAEPTTTMDTTPPGAPTTANTTYTKNTGGVVADGISQWN